MFQYPKITKDFIESLQKNPSPPLSKLGPEKARNVLDTIQENDNFKENPSLSYQEIPIEFEIPFSIIIVRPKSTANKPIPVILYIHGGGWVLGNFKTHAHLIAELSSRTGLAIVFVEYSRSPETKFPNQLYQANKALEYISTHNLNLDLNSLFIAGDSVGGNMATVLTHLLSKKNIKIKAEILLYPVTNANFETESYNRFQDGPWLTKDSMIWFYESYAPGKIKFSPLASPLLLTKNDLKNMPPTLIITNDYDVLRDEGEEYARKLIDASVEVVAVRFLGTIHDSLMLRPLRDLPTADAALSLIADFIKKHL